MVEIGATIAAKVTSIEPYGVWLEHRGEKVMVLVPDLSWEPFQNVSEIVTVGQTLNVKAMRYNYPQHVIVGSVKALQPEKNPYRQLSHLPPDTPLKATVTLCAGNGSVAVALPNNIWAELSTYQLASQLHHGDEIEVVISSLEVDEGRLVVRLVQQDQIASTGDLVSAS